MTEADLATPWEAWLEIGLGVICRGDSDRFWRMSVREWLAALEGYAASRGGGRKRGGAPMTRERLAELASQYPDTPNTRRKGGAL
ncbi:MAG: phage tail assembly chaperone [Hyphomonadaceae bacterium]|nr:phage tail assembly chaperone [Hyphomonadaceae bacterium]